MKFNYGASLWSRGILSAQGTASDPIIITSIYDDSARRDSNGDGSTTSANPGQWESLYLDGTTTLRHFEIRYAGNAVTPGHTYEPYRVPSIQVRNGAAVAADFLRVIGAENEGVFVAAGSLQLSNSEVIQSGRTAIDVNGSATLSHSLIQGAPLGVRVRVNANASGTDNAFVGLANSIQNDQNVLDRANFENNWWGQLGGPHDPSSADGQTNLNPAGVPVGDWVRYANWKTTPPAGMTFGPLVQSIRYAKEAAAEEVLYVEFEQPILATSIDLNDFGISGPGDATFFNIRQITSTTFRLSLRGPSNGSSSYLPLIPGQYQLTIGPTILSLSNQAMSEAFVGSFSIDGSGPRVTASTPAPQSIVSQSFNSIDVTFNESIDPRKIDLNGVRLLKVNATNRTILATSMLAENRVRFHFDPQTENGSYEFIIEPWAVFDRQGNAMNADGDGINGETGSPEFDGYRMVFGLQRQSLKIVSQVPATSTNDAIEMIEVTFNQPVAANSFSPSDVTLVGPVGQVEIVSVTRISDTRFRIATQRATADGSYELSIGPAITDVGGVPMDQDGDGNTGELDDRYRSTILLAGAGPQVLKTTPRQPTAAPVSFVDVEFSEPIQFASITPVDIFIQGPQGAIVVTAIESLSATTVRARFAPQSIEGVYIVRIGPNISDAGGSLMDQDRDGRLGESIDDVYSGTFSIDATGPRVVAAAPSGGTNTPFSTIDLTFSEAIDPTSVTLSDIVLTGPDGSIQATQVVVMDSNKVRVHLPLQSKRGLYSLTIGPNIVDLVGNAMDNNQNGILGEASDVYTNTISLALPDLAIESATAPLTVLNGATFEVAYTIRNIQSGTANAPWIDRVVFSFDRFYGNNDDIVLESRSVTSSLDSNGAYTRTLSATAPYGFTGEASLFFVTDAGGVLSESDEQNNRIEKRVQIQFQKPPADLIVDGIHASGPIGRGAALPLTYRVRNDGIAGTAQNQWSDQVYLSTNATLDGSDWLIGTVSHSGALESGASYSVSPSLLIPTQMPLGDYFVLVRTDAANQVDEPSAEDNNVMASTTAISVTAAPLPDLVLANLRPDPSSSLVSGESIVIHWNGQNSGNLNASGSWTDRIYLSKDNLLSSEDWLLGDVEQNRTLAPNQTYSASLTKHLPEGIQGEYFLIGVSDVANTIVEGDGELTSRFPSNPFNVSLFPYADLKVTEVSAPPLVIGDPVDLLVTWKVDNVGAGAGRTSSWTDRVVLSSNATLGDGDDITIGRFEHQGSMPASSQYERSEIIALPPRISGRFTLFVQTDANDEVFEISGHQPNEKALSHVVDIAQKPYADLVVDSVSTAGTPVSGQPLSVSWTVSNRGIATTDQSTWTDYLYVSRDPTGITGMRLIGSSTHGGSLGVNQNYSRTTEVVLPRDLDGLHYLFVRTGGPYEFIYADVGNQNRSAAIDVLFVPPPPVDLRVTGVELQG